MPVNKNIRIEVLNDTWVLPDQAPPALLNAAGNYSIDISCALVFAALWTRPPVRYGFSLSDCWAWLRYFPAIAVNPELRLREEWTSLDPHHKTVLSGDFGVGFTTWFLHKTLGFAAYADTLWVVNTQQPEDFQLGPTKARGPQKSPDYIATDSAGNYSVIECKGTQTSHASLLEAIERGRPQKENLQAIGETQIQHSLVAGLFIPQFGNAELPSLIVADPEWKEVKERLGRLTPNQLGRGVAQVAHAKELAIFDLSQTANTLVRVKGSADSLSAAFARDKQSRSTERTITADAVQVRREYIWPQSTQISADVSISGVRFEGLLPAAEVERLQAVVSPDEYGEQAREQSLVTHWSVTSHDQSVQLRSPLGSIYKLTLLD
jgi:hypothetical protein